MPITLGDTTITGLGVGGLPNGVVNAGNIATGAVTSEKLGSAGMVVKTTGYTTGYGAGARLSHSSTSWVTVPLAGTSLDGPRDVITPNNDVFRFEKLRSDTQLRIRVNGFPWYMPAGTAGWGMRIRYYAGSGSIGNGGNYGILEKLSEGIANGWGWGGYGGNAGVANYAIDTAHSSAPSFFTARTGAQYFFFEVYAWSSTTLLFLDYDASYPKYGSFMVEEYIA